MSNRRGSGRNGSGDGNPRLLSRMWGALGLAVITLAMAIVAQAQFDTATVLGSVTDDSGAVVPRATVTLRNVATGVTATSSSTPALASTR